MTAKNNHTIGAAAQVSTELSINFGSSLAGLAIPVVGSPVVVAARQLVMVAVLLPFYRPRLAHLSWKRLWPALALGLTLAVMNLTFYESVHLLGLGIAATIEFLGPFALVLAASRRLIDFACALAAATGVVLLTWSDGELNIPGLLYALAAAACWATYILLTKRVAMTFPGLEGISLASVVSLILVLPLALVTIPASGIGWGMIGMLAAIGALSSAYPYTLDTFILRRLPQHLYSIITSVGPVIAALFGALVLGESFSFVQLVAIVLVCAAAGTAIATQREEPKSDLELTADAMA